jgi:hypothetical protein
VRTALCRKRMQHTHCNSMNARLYVRTPQAAVTVSYALLCPAVLFLGSNPACSCCLCCTGLQCFSETALCGLQPPLCMPVSTSLAGLPSTCQWAVAPSLHCPSLVSLSVSVLCWIALDSCVMC